MTKFYSEIVASIPVLHNCVDVRSVSVAMVFVDVVSFRATEKPASPSLLYEKVSRVFLLGVFQVVLRVLLCAR